MSEGFVEVHQRSETRINMPVLYGAYPLEFTRTSLYWCTTGVLMPPGRIRTCNRRIRSSKSSVQGCSPSVNNPQTVRTTGEGGQERGFDPAKKVEYRMRHLQVDTEGLVCSGCESTAPECPRPTA